ncbi:PAS domain-containing protein [Chitinimonas koreensis]|uniref:PAS domain-containing protein n=1 Tax=Chitinimonas koreensis TaxID=356302 RepID=UPI00048F2FEF|nr:PAS domain-containing protein [Chitinimonas koreensis]QNM96564.1 PAS domain-containing protein [Chitinimonas koreensis]
MIVRKYFPSNPSLSNEAMIDGFKQGNAILAGLRTVAFALTLGRDRLLHLSHSASELYGEPVGVLADHPNFWLEAIHPEDKPAVWLGLDKLRDMPGSEIEFTYRLVASDGDISWVRQRCRIAANEAGVPVRIDCVVSPCLPPAPAAPRHEIGNAVFSACGDALLVRDAATLDVVDANTAALALLACSRAELLRQRLADFSARTEGFDVRAETPYLDAVRRGQVQRYDWLVTPRVGEPRWVEAVSSPLVHLGRPCLLTVLRDIDSRHRELERQTLASELIERSRDIVAYADPAGQLHALNPAGRALIGVANEAVRDFFVTDLVPAWAQPHFLQTCVPMATRDGVWQGELALVSRDGRNLPVMLTLLAHKRSGALKGYSLIGQDIAPWKLKEQRHKRDKETLEADKLLQEKLLENVSAGLLPPLDQLRQIVQILERNPAEVSRALPHLKRAIEQAHRLASATHEFLKAGAQRDLPDNKGH